jgi:hypothetical protein
MMLNRLKKETPFLKFYMLAMFLSQVAKLMGEHKHDGPASSKRFEAENRLDAYFFSFIRFPSFRTRAGANCLPEGLESVFSCDPTSTPEASEGPELRNF